MVPGPEKERAEVTWGLLGPGIAWQQLPGTGHGGHLLVTLPGSLRDGTAVQATIP